MHACVLGHRVARVAPSPRPLGPRAVRVPRPQSPVRREHPRGVARRGRRGAGGGSDARERLGGDGTRIRRGEHRDERRRERQDERPHGRARPLERLAKKIK